MRTQTLIDLGLLECLLPLLRRSIVVSGAIPPKGPKGPKGETEKTEKMKKKKKKLKKKKKKKATTTASTTPLMESIKIIDSIHIVGDLMIITAEGKCPARMRLVRQVIDRGIISLVIAQSLRPEANADLQVEAALALINAIQGASHEDVERLWDHERFSECLVTLRSRCGTHGAYYPKGYAVGADKVTFAHVVDLSRDLDEILEARQALEEKAEEEEEEEEEKKRQEQRAERKYPVHVLPTLSSGRMTLTSPSSDSSSSSSSLPSLPSARSSSSSSAPPVPRTAARAIPQLTWQFQEHLYF